MEILLVDDDPGDVQLALEAFVDGRLGNLSTSPRMVRRRWRFSAEGVAPMRRGPTRPWIEHARKDGHEVLADLKADPALAGIPVAIVTEFGGGRNSNGLHSAWPAMSPSHRVPKLMIAVCSIHIFR